MIHPEIPTVTNGLPKKLPTKSLTTLAKTEAVTQVTEVTGKYSPIGREGCVAIGLYFPGFGLPGYLSLSSISIYLNRKKEEREGAVTVSVTSGNSGASAVTGAWGRGVSRPRAAIVAPSTAELSRACAR